VTRTRFALAIGVLAAAALSSLPGNATEAVALPDGIWAATATGAGTSALIDTQATGGAVYVANDSAPFAEASVTSAPSSEAIGSYAYDKNAATGVYSIVSASSQQNGGPPLPDLKNTAFSRYPSGGTSEAGYGASRTAGPLAVDGAVATAKTDEGLATSDVRSARMDLTGPAAFTTAAQDASASSRAEARGLHADSISRVFGISVGGVLTIDQVIGESHASTIQGVDHAETAFQVLGARVNGTPVTIGADGVGVAGRPDGTTPGLVAAVNGALNARLAAAGITVSVLQPVTSEKDGASAATPGLAITIVIPAQQGLPGETVALVLGRSSANASLVSVVLPLPAVIPPVGGAPSTVTTVTTIGGSVPGSEAAATVSRAFRSIPRVPPVVMLFVLWQVWTLGWVALAWWRREMAKGQA